MNILHVIYTLGNGGAEKFAVELCNELAVTNKVILSTVKPIEEWMLPPKKLSKDIKLFALETNKKYSLSLFFKLFQLIKQTQPDIVHVHSSILVFYLYIISFFFQKTQFIQTVHSTITPAYAKLFNFLQRLRFINRNFVNVCVSKNILEQYKLAYPKLNFVQIDNGINKLSITDKFIITKHEVQNLKKDEDTIIFTAIGNYSNFKNFSMLANVFKELNQENINVILLLIGGDKSSNLKNYKEVASRKGKNIYQLGIKDNVADYLKCSDALIMSSTREGMPLVVLEALSFGLPVISTPAGGVVDLIENKVNGIITTGFDKEDLLHAIRFFLSMPKVLKEKIRQNNLKKFAQFYSIDQCAGRYITLVYQKK